MNKYIADKVEERLNCVVSQGYGMTETSPALFQPSGKKKNGKASILEVQLPLSINLSDFRYPAQTYGSMTEKVIPISRSLTHGEVY